MCVQYLPHLKNIQSNIRRIHTQLYSGQIIKAKLEHEGILEQPYYTHIIYERKMPIDK